MFCVYEGGREGKEVCTCTHAYIGLQGLSVVRLVYFNREKGWGDCRGCKKNIGLAFSKY